MNIVGTDYKIKVVKDANLLSDDNWGGQCSYTSKEIKVVSHLLNGEKISAEYMKETLLHELAHAFLYQTGNTEINNEQIAEILAHFALFITKHSKGIDKLLKGK